MSATAASPIRLRLFGWDDPSIVAEASAEMSGLDLLRAVIDGSLPPPPFARTLGFELVKVRAGLALFSVQPAEFHYNPLGTVHGGVAATLLDSAMGCAVQTLLAAGRSFTTLQLDVRFVRPMTVDTGIVLGEGTVVHAGRTLATAEGRVTARATGKLLAHASTTCLLLDAT